MALTKIGINFSRLTNISNPPSFDIGNSTEEIVNNIPSKANQITEGWLGFGILAALFFYLQWIFRRDMYNYGDYGLNVNRSIGLSCCICSILGLYCLNMGYFVNFFHVAIFIIVTFIEVIVVWKMSR